MHKFLFVKHKRRFKKKLAGKAGTYPEEEKKGQFLSPEINFLNKNGNIF